MRGKHSGRADTAVQTTRRADGQIGVSSKQMSGWECAEGDTSRKTRTEAEDWVPARVRTIPDALTCLAAL